MKRLTPEQLCLNLEKLQAKLRAQDVEVPFSGENYCQNHLDLVSLYDMNNIEIPEVFVPPLQPFFFHLLV